MSLVNSSSEAFYERIWDLFSVNFESIEAVQGQLESGGIPDTLICSHNKGSYDIVCGYY